jgi:hypothetical protein
MVEEWSRIDRGLVEEKSRYGRGMVEEWSSLLDAACEVVQAESGSIGRPRILEHVTQEQLLGKR